MNTWRICNHCEHCVYDVGSGLQCDFDYPDLKSVTAEETCRYFSLNEDYVDELTEEIDDLRAKLAAAEKERDNAKLMMLAHMGIGDNLEQERDEARAHNAVLRKGLEDIVKEGTTIDDAYGKLYDSLAVMAIETLRITPSDSAAKVHGIVELLADAINETKNGEKFSAGFVLTAQKALAEWRGDMVSKDDVICPYCKRKHSKNKALGTTTGLINYGGMERSIVCEGCGKWFKCVVEVQIKYRTSKY